ncbi:MAG: hypothetical protein SFX19_01715 [Alphaproteobacteria bacterium]|nr:hypothetical protein [Alphaproteobacteria bacterium]
MDSSGKDWEDVIPKQKDWTKDAAQQMALRLLADRDRYWKVVQFADGCEIELQPAQDLNGYHPVIPKGFETICDALLEHILRHHLTQEQAAALSPEAIEAAVENVFVSDVEKMEEHQARKVPPAIVIGDYTPPPGSFPIMDKRATLSLKTPAHEREIHWGRVERSDFNRVRIFGVEMSVEELKQAVGLWQKKVGSHASELNSMHQRIL